MQYIVPIALVLTVAWFATFLLLIGRLASESRDIPAPRMDRPGRALIGSVRLAYLIGLPTVFVVEIVNALGLLF